MLALLMFLAMVFPGSAVAAEAHDVFYQGNLAPRNIVPTFENGYLVVYDIDSKIALYAPDGSLVYKAAAQVDGASWVHVSNAGVDSDGTLAAAVEYRRPKASDQRGGIAILDRTGAQTLFLDTGEYSPTHVSFGPDHSIWTIGWRRNASDSDYFVLRNYSIAGQLIGAFLSRSSFEPEPDPVGPCEGGWQLRVVNGKVGALFYSSSILKPGQRPRPLAEWVETDLKGKEIGRYDVPASMLAFTQGGALYAQLPGGISVFEWATSHWRPLTGMPDGILVGAEGASLVFELRGENTLRWVPVSQ
jgi:hypothetical protein